MRSAEQTYGSPGLPGLLHYRSSDVSFADVVRIRYISQGPELFQWSHPDDDSDIGRFVVRFVFDDGIGEPALAVR